MCICMCGVRGCVYDCICVGICLFERACMCVYACVKTVQVCLLLHLCVCLYVCVRVCICVHRCCCCYPHHTVCLLPCILLNTIRRALCPLFRVCVGVHTQRQILWSGVRPTRAVHLPPVLHLSKAVYILSLFAVMCVSMCWCYPAFHVRQRLTRCRHS